MLSRWRSPSPASFGVEVAYLRGAEENLAELSVLADDDDDLSGQSIRLTNRLRDALLHVHPETHRGRSHTADRALPTRTPV